MTIKQMMYGAAGVAILLTALMSAFTIGVVHRIHNAPDDAGLECTMTTVVDENSAISITVRVTKQVECRAVAFERLG